MLSSPGLGLAGLSWARLDSGGLLGTAALACARLGLNELELVGLGLTGLS